MVRVVLDTNITVSAFITYGRNEWQILEKVVQGEIISLLSDTMLEEFDEVMSYKKFGYTEDQIGYMKLFLIGISHIVVPKEKVGIIKRTHQTIGYLSVP